MEFKVYSILDAERLSVLYKVCALLKTTLVPTYFNFMINCLDGAQQ